MLGSSEMFYSSQWSAWLSVTGVILCLDSVCLLHEHVLSFSEQNLTLSARAVCKRCVKFHSEQNVYALNKAGLVMLYVG